ncbi:MAG: extensin family protein [Myxococcota bacterium]
MTVRPPAARLKSAEVGAGRRAPAVDWAARRSHAREPAPRPCSRAAATTTTPAPPGGRRSRASSARQHRHRHRPAGHRHRARHRPRQHGRPRRHRRDRPPAKTPCTASSARPAPPTPTAPTTAGVTSTGAADSFPRGTCSAPCDRFCPDGDGFPVTFCSDIDELPAGAAFLGDGGCLSRCDFALYPYTGCREDYGCVPSTRANEPGTETWTCQPNVDSALTSCLQDLADRGFPFTPTIIADSAPAGLPNLTCHVEEPITIRSGYRGVDIIYYNGTTPGSIDGACELGRAVADSIEDVEDDGVTVLRHLGTYVCRTIAGTQTLSRHAYGDALDIYGFDFANGDAYTLVGDWEHDTTSPSSTAGAWLYDTVHGWHDQELWNILLTPNYNADHDNHVHADLTPGSDFIGFTGPYFLGPNPTGD